MKKKNWKNQVIFVLEKNRKPIPKPRQYQSGIGNFSLICVIGIWDPRNFPALLLGNPRETPAWCFVPRSTRFDCMNLHLLHIGPSHLLFFFFLCYLLHFFTVKLPHHVCFSETKRCRCHGQLEIKKDINNSKCLWSEKKDGVDQCVYIDLIGLGNRQRNRLIWLINCLPCVSRFGCFRVFARKLFLATVDCVYCKI